MKITGGRSRGRVLSSLKGMDIRPTSSKVREAIFNLLGQDMSGLKIFDIFAGTGIMGIEALSRGAEEAVFIDKSSLAMQLIKKNLALCGYEGRSRVLKRDIMDGSRLDSLVEGKSFDVAFIDPPYGKDILPLVLEMLSHCDVLKPGAVVVTESAKGDPMPERSGFLVLSGRKIYGDTKIEIYESERDI
jgi:16S rRNA (guanine966-N2)-methyltransferase